MESNTGSPPTTAPELPDAGSYALDPPHTFVYLAARHLIVGMVRGRFDRSSGTLIVARELGDCRLDVTIDTTSVSTQNAMRDEDLRSGAFFDVGHFPTATYRARGIRPTGAAWIIDGELTIRGVTKVVPLTFTYRGTAATVSGKPRRIAFQGTAALKRAEFGMTRDLVSEIGARSSTPDVTLEINAEALATDQPFR